MNLKFCGTAPARPSDPRVEAPRCGAVLATAWIACALLLSACAEQHIRAAALGDFREGQYEKSVQRLETGIKDHPNSGVLRSGLIEVRSDALTKLWADAAAAKTAGRLDDAKQILLRAAALEPAHARTRSLLESLDVERRQRVALDEIHALMRGKRATTALQRIEQALKDDPRHPELLSLQRQLEMDQRLARGGSSIPALAETRSISLDFRDAGLRNVLDVVTRNSGVNFILDKDIRPDIRVTVYLRSARVEDAIDLITSTHQLSKKVIDSKTLLIYPNTPDKQREHQEQVVKVFYLANAEAKNAAAFLRAMIKVRDPYVDERTNMIAVRDSAENVQLAERMIAMFDTAEPEVLLDVQVIELRTTRLTELGIKFPNTLGLTPLPPSGQSTQGGLTLGNIQGLTRDRIGLSIGGVTVNLRREAGDYNVLANPSIRAKNKEKAKVMVGDKLPVVTTTTGVGGFVSDNISYVDVGLKLEVEPTVFVDDEVAIRIGLEVSSLASQIKTSSGGLAYQIGTRNASTLLRLRDGETQLLAGLLNKEERSDASRIPGLGDLPLAGRLFSSTLDNSQQTELVLSITPHVLRNLRRPTASESEVWVGTDAQPRIRPAGGVVMDAGEPAVAAESKPANTAATQQAPAVVTPPAASPLPSLQWSGPASVKVGEEFEAQLQLHSEVALRGAPLMLDLDPQRFKVLEVLEGGFFKQDSTPTSFTHSLEGQGAQVRVGVLRNQASGATGDGTLVGLRLKALQPGKAQIRLTSMEPISLGAPMARPVLPVVLDVEVAP